jgi:Recombination endonuclease VII
MNPCVNAGDDRNHQKRVTTLLGPRLGYWCATCRRERNKAGRTARRAAHVERTYGLSPADVELIVASMPVNAAGVPVCPGCQRATGTRKALAADHDHEMERMGLPMRETVRGFLCGPCNQTIGRYGVEALLRLAAYLVAPPAFDALGTHPNLNKLQWRIVPNS